MTTGLEIAGLTVGYRTARGVARAVDEVSLAVAGGRTLGIVGESGSGKTTIAHALGRHLPTGGQVLGGRITLDGVDVLGLSPRELRRWRTTDLAFVHQEAGAALDPTMRVGAQLDEALALQGRPRADRRREVIELLDRVRLPDPAAAARRYPHQLSGGQQQRVVIAAALAKRPRLLVLDEPTTGLDASVEADILALIEELRTELAAAVVLISHNLALVGRLCDELAVLYAGRVVEHGSAGEVLRAPAHPYTAALLAAVPTLGVPRGLRRLAAIPGRAATPGSMIGSAVGGCRFAPRCGFADQRCHDIEPDATIIGDRVVRCHYAGTLSPAPTTAPTTPVSRPAADEPRLRVAGLTRRFGGFTAVDNVSFDIAPAEVFGLVGESGSGKTTLARAVAGLGPRSGGGTLTLSGAALPARLSRRRTEVLRRLQMVFQQPDATLNPAHRVRTVLGRALRTLRGTGTVADLARRTQLDVALLDARTTALSGGQQQRVAIARAFAGSPELVICDEPVSALDASVQAGVLELLATQRDRTGTSYLFISHDLAVVSYLADRVGVLYRGTLVEVGGTADVLAGPHHPYTDLLVSAAIRAAPPTPVVRADPAPGGCVFAARCPHHIGPICDTQPPPAHRIGAGHDVSCHLPVTRLPSRGDLTKGEFR